MAKTPLKVIFLADTRPGHYHLAQGVIAALARFRPVEVTRIEVKRKWIVPTRWLRRRISAKSFFPPRMLRMAYRIDAYALPKADLVVSAGGETHEPNICVARFLGSPSIFCGSLLRGLGPENFSLIISSYDRDAGSDRHMVVLKPSSIDPDALGRPLSVPRYGPERRPKLAGLLIGGIPSVPLSAGGVGVSAYLHRRNRQGVGDALAHFHFAVDTRPCGRPDRRARQGRERCRPLHRRPADRRAWHLRPYSSPRPKSSSYEQFEHHDLEGGPLPVLADWRGAGRSPLHRRGAELSKLPRQQ